LKFILAHNLCPNLRSLKGFVFNVSNVKVPSLPLMPNLEVICVSFADWTGRFNLVKEALNLIKVFYANLLNILIILYRISCNSWSKIHPI
jgi:hypothetical protein